MMPTQAAELGPSIKHARAATVARAAHVQVTVFNIVAAILASHSRGVIGDRGRRALVCLNS